MKTPPRWRVKDEHGEDLIAFWKRLPPHSNEYAAAEIIEELEQQLVVIVTAWACLLRRIASTPAVTQHGLLDMTADMLEAHQYSDLARRVRATRKEMPDCPIAGVWRSPT